MAISTSKATLAADIYTVWNHVTCLENYSWRSDLSKIEVINDKEFAEYTHNGICTYFTITAKKRYERWEFDMENSNIKGHWIGLFTQRGNETEIEFIEDVTAKKFFMKPFVKSYLKKQQATYINDLKKVLNCES